MAHKLQLKGRCRNSSVKRESQGNCLAGCRADFGRVCDSRPFRRGDLDRMLTQHRTSGGSNDSTYCQRVDIHYHRPRFYYYSLNIKPDPDLPAGFAAGTAPQGRTIHESAEDTCLCHDRPQ